jgi:hypothetical protein
MKCYHAPLMECKKPHGYYGYCEGCTVPESFGWFIVQVKPGHFKWERRFVLKRDREAELRGYQLQISEIQKEVSKLMAIPSREEYFNKRKESKND